MSFKNIHLLPFPVLIISKDRDETCLAYNSRFKNVLDTQARPPLKLSEMWDGKKVSDLLNSKVIFSHDDKACYKVKFINGKFDNKNVTYILFIDVTDLTLSQEQLKKELAEADALAEMKSNFLATMSHEIRTPMQSIYGLLELISEEEISQSVEDMLKTAKESANNLLEILDDILDHAKIDAEKMELDAFEVPIRMLAYGTIEALSVKAPGGHVKLLTDIAEDVPFVVKGDPKRLRQILTNLIGNALKFTHEGTVTLKITTDAKNIISSDFGVGLRFEIIDTGIGMPPEVCESLFQAFQQANSSTTRLYGGTGLGLSISKKLVAIMNGEIGVTSEQGKGSTFWFEIPTEAVSTDESSVELPDLTGISILSVEDHPQGAREIVNSLRSMGAEIENTGSFEGGKDLIDKRRYDVVICDQSLPDGKGVDLMKYIAKTIPSTALILYTVLDDYGLSQSCKAMGATYLVKPASRVGLGEAVLGAASSQNKFISSRPRKILIAEDTESVRYILEKQFKQIDATADFVENGAIAFEKYKTGDYGLIITDLHMPKLDGYGLVKKIRKAEEEFEKNNNTTDPRLPVVVLTADVQLAQRQAYLTHGFDECLLKPVSIGQLRRLLTRWDMVQEQAPSPAPRLNTVKNKQANDQSNKHLESIDLKAMEEQMGEVTQDNLEMIGMFIDMTEPQITKLRDFSDKGDIKGLAEAAHSLKGGARSACCMALGQLAYELQESAEDGRNKSELIEEIEAEFTRIKETLADLLKEAS